MKITAPQANAVFKITSIPEWPSISFATDATGAHKWHWTISWDTFTKSGTASTSNGQWDAKSVTTNFGGTLVVRAEAGAAHASVSVFVQGTNPSHAEVTTFLGKQKQADGFDKILQQESHFTHFNAHGQPKKSYDGGYGMAQLTNPKPTFEQTWNWQKNVEGGVALFHTKRTAALAWLSQSKRAYTDEQLKYETVCRWNGGTYHEWDAKSSAWVRKSNILCDTRTGNMGWDMTDPSNKGKTEADLHKRDAGSYNKGPGKDAHWSNFGVCYADHLLG